MIKLKRVFGKMWGKCLTVVKQFFPWLKAMLNKTKKWFVNKKKHERFIIGGIIFASLLVIVVCGFTIDFSRLFGSVYDIEDISTNIDDIKIGDTINYTANGYSDWEVLNINKEDNTIDIVTKTTPEYITVPCEMGTCNNYYTILQKAADKYLDGKYAINSRSIGLDDFNVFRSLHSTYDDFWINSKSSDCLYYSHSSQCFGGSNTDYTGYYVPEVQINVPDTSNMSVGDIYNYSLNGIDEWIVTYIWTGTINMIPKHAPVVDFSNIDKDGVTSFLKKEKEKFYDENVNYVDDLYSGDSSLLSSLNYTDINSEYSYFYWGTSQTTSSNYVNGSDISTVSTRYGLNAFYKVSSGVLSTTTVHFDVYSFSAGFRPVVTIKYSDEQKNGNVLNENLKIGDYVKYSANGYNNWKVLNIDKKSNTVDIISGGIVKNITLEGKEDYTNFSEILQDEVDKYKYGKEALSARSVGFDDLSNLKLLNDQLSARYFLNNKMMYRPLQYNGEYTKKMAYVVQVGYYDLLESEISSDWAIVAHEDSDKSQFDYKYMSGLRPIITLELPKVEKIENFDNVPPVDEANNILITEQTRINKSAQSVIKDNEINEENVVKFVSGDSEDECSEVKIKQDNYCDFIIFITINIILTLILFSIDKIKEWLFKHKKNKKFVVTSASVFVLVVVTVFALTLNSKNITGSIYDINNIGSNINDLHVGDTINYEANGYKDWEVLNINKEDNTIDIVSKTSTENITFKYADLENYLDILQETANKYLDGKEAIAARAVNEDDLKGFEANDNFWIAKEAKGYYHTNIGAYWPPNSNTIGYILPVVTLGFADTTNFAVGDNFTYNLNDVSEWVILYVEDSTSISIIPKEPIAFETTINDSDVAGYINKELEMYKSESVVSVRSIATSDIDALTSIKYREEKYSERFYTGEILASAPGSSSDNGVNLIFNRFDYEYLYRSSWDLSYDTSFSNAYDRLYESGFRPVITIKYSDKEKSGKDIKTSLEVGDYVKYSANGYNNWKVLNINKESNTVDIISGGLVKNVTLEGKSSYNNLEKILQDEVDKYKVGKYAVSARAVSTKDLDLLRLMKDELPIRFFLNDKIKYTDKGEGNSYWGTPTYTVGVAYYDLTISDISYDWSILEQEYSSEESYSYKYTAGLRPIITLDLNETEEIKVDKVEDVTTKNNTLITEQKKYNKTAQNPIKNNKIEVITDEEYESFDIVEESECKYNESESSDPKDSVKYKIVICLFTINIVILIAIIILNLIGFKKKRQKIKE